MRRTILLTFLCLCTLGAYATDNRREHIDEPDTCIHLGEVVVTGVTGNARLREIAAPISIVQAENLRMYTSTNLIDAISHQPGINQITTGASISKPVIRGLGYNRVLVVNDGVRQEGQQWGDEHGIEVDGNAVHSLEILKGPASLMYGSDAMAGAIVMHDAPTMPEGETAGEIGAGYQTNNGLYDLTAAMRGNQKGFVWNWRASHKSAHDYKAPLEGFVPNTRFSEQALSGMVGLNRYWGFSHLKLGYYHLRPGMIEAELFADKDNDSYNGHSYRIAREKEAEDVFPYQNVRHYKAVLDNSFNLPVGTLKAIVGYQQNRRQEYEGEALPVGEEAHPELDFRLHTLTYDTRYVLPYGESNGKVNVGVAGMYQNSEDLGQESLIPAYHLFDIGAFATASQDLTDQWHLSGGLRYDNRHSQWSPILGGDREKRSWDAFSGSLGAIYNASRYLDIKVNASHGFRAPNMSELGSDGEHEGTFRYEVGNAQLKAENSWQFDAGMDYAYGILSFSFSLFANHISNYIFLQREASTGLDTDRFRFTSGNADILGGEARVILHFFHHLHFENTFSFVNGRQPDKSQEEKWLPYMPAPRWLTSLHYDIPVRSTYLRHLYAEAETDANFRQNHFMAAYGTETATPAYMLLNLSAGTDLCVRGRKICSVYLTASNLLNKSYQSHLSRLKYAYTLPLTGYQGIHNMGRNIGIRVLVPLNITHAE